MSTKKEKEFLTILIFETRKENKEIDSNEEVKYNSDEIQFSKKRTASYINKSIDEFTLRDINNKLYKIYEGVDDCIADGIAIENGRTLYIVDSGKDGGQISFGIKETITIIDKKLRQESLEEINDRAIQDRFVSEELFEKLGHAPDQHSSSNIGRKVSSELSTNSKQSQNNQGRVFEGDENRRVQIKSSLKHIPDTNLKDKVYNAEYITDEEYLELAEDFSQDSQGNFLTEEQDGRRDSSEDYDNIRGDSVGRSNYAKNSGTEIKFSLKSFSEQVDDVLSGEDTCVLEKILLKSCVMLV